MLIILLLLSAYLIGAIPTAYLIARWNQMDIFAEGSGNMGASNVSRLLGLRWGLLTFALDVLKGILAVGIVIAVLSYNPIWISLATGAAICGHSWSILAAILTYDPSQGFKLRGGKGAATGFGSFFWVAPAYILVGMLIVAALVIAISRTFSIAAIVSWCVGFCWMLYSILSGAHESIWYLYIVLTTGLILTRILGNLQRIAKGTERKLEGKEG